MQKLLTVEEAAKPLGLTPKAVRLKIARRELPFRKLGRLIRIPASDLEKYLNTLSGCDVDEALERIEGKAA